MSKGSPVFYRQNAKKLELQHCNNFTAITCTSITPRWWQCCSFAPNCLPFQKEFFALEYNSSRGIINIIPYIFTYIYSHYVVSYVKFHCYLTHVPYFRRFGEHCAKQKRNWRVDKMHLSQNYSSGYS